MQRVKSAWVIALKSSAQRPLSIWAFVTRIAQTRFTRTMTSRVNLCAKSVVRPRRARRARRALRPPLTPILVVLTAPVQIVHFLLFAGRLAATMNRGANLL